MSNPNNAINQVFMRIAERAEHSDLQLLVNTFVDIGNLFTVLSTRNNQVIYGRRGAGKTHAFKYLLNSVNSSGDIGIYIDLRTLGSSNSFYGDKETTISQRATKLLIDLITSLHSSIYKHFAQKEDNTALAALDTHLDLLSTHVIDIRVESETINNKLASVSFGTIERILKGIAKALAPRKVWLLLDEWSSIPLEIQPYLADFIRKSILPVENVIVKIASIEHRTSFYLPKKNNEYVGIELGADMSVAVNLDDYLVFDNDPKIARVFFQELLYKHYQATELQAMVKLAVSSEDLIRQAFTQINVFDEFVRASEGVPRDAMMIIGNAAQKALFSSISMEHIRAAARNLYLMSKNAQIGKNVPAKTLLEWTIDEVIKKRKSRAFLLRSGERYELIDFLFDNRILHIMKRSISARDQPGIKYDVYKIDYGCYVELINTSRSPQLLLPLEDFKQLDDRDLLNVPFDDYRSIRRAILDMKRAEKHLAGVIEFQESKIE